MKRATFNHYEQAFASWLRDNRVQYVAVDEQKRAAFGKSSLKSFDYLITLPDQPVIIAEVKGRSFKGKSLDRLKGLECWVTADDVDGLARWQEVFGPTHRAAFIFAYRIENIDVDLDGRETYEYDGSRYIFFCVRLDDYRTFMKLRSPRWRTVTLPAAKFRQFAIQMQSLLS